MTIFVTRSGRRVPERDTDQAGSEMLVRSVSRNADGTARERPTVAVSPEIAINGQSPEQIAEDLDTRGYLPPEEPMMREEHARIVAARRIGSRDAAILWDVCGRGVPLGYALLRAGVEASKRKSARRSMQRLIRDIGWASE
jgi:hypothetical protein